MRRDGNFIGLVGSFAATWPLAARAQHPAGNMPVVTHRQCQKGRRRHRVHRRVSEVRLSQAGLTEGTDLAVRNITGWTVTMRSFPQS